MSGGTATAIGSSIFVSSVHNHAARLSSFATRPTRSRQVLDSGALPLGRFFLQQKFSFAMYIQDMP